MRATSCSSPFRIRRRCRWPLGSLPEARRSSTFRPISGSKTLLSTSAGTPRPTPPPTCSRAPRSVCPSSSPTILPVRPRPAKRAEARSWPVRAAIPLPLHWPPRPPCARGSSPKRARSWWTPFRASRARARRRPPARISALPTRTLKRTAWPRIAIRPRSSKFSTSKGASCSRRTSRRRSADCSPRSTCRFRPTPLRTPPPCSSAIARSTREIPSCACCPRGSCRRLRRWSARTAPISVWP